MEIRWVALGCVALISGILEAVSATVMIEPDAEWRWKKGTEAPSSPDGAAWRQRGFDDASWARGRAPFYYGEPLTGTLLADMRNGYTCVFLRREFAISDPAELGAVRLRALSDDGFAAWINGIPVARFNMPEGELPFNTTASGTFNEPLPTETYEIANFAEILRSGANVLAVQACNVSIGGSSDFVFEASLETEVDDVPPRIEKLLPPAGSRMRDLTQITVVFSEAVDGVDATDLRVGGVGAERVTGFDGDQYVFEFPSVPPGTLTVAWAANADIRDRSARRNAFAGGAWEYVIDPNLPPPGVTISEFMADNDDTLNDQDGDASDWIEIENASEQAVSLAGWSLSNELTNPKLWRFPAVSLGSRSRLLVFASGKNRVPLAGELHTNFRIAREGGFLGLYRPDGTPASVFASYPAQREDVSYGRLPTDALKTGYFPTPTPGGVNEEGGPGFAPDVVFSRIGGTFAEPFELLLRPSDAGAGVVVRYTLDGTVPTELSAEFRNPITIAASIRVRARAFAPGLLPGRLVGESYAQLNPTAASATSNLPLVLIHSFGGGAVPANGEYPATVWMFEPRSGSASMTNAPDLRSRARINIRGSSTLFQSKRNYSVEFRDEREADRRLSPLGLPEDSDWILYAPNNFEPILIHNPFIYRVSESIGRYAPRTRFVEVYVQTGAGSVASAQYAGIYVLMEKIKRGDDRVDVDRLEPEHGVPPQITGGYILKVDRLDPGDSGLVAGGQAMGFVEPKEEEMDLPQRAPQRSYIRNYLDRFGQALASANWRDPVTGWRAYVDEDSWIDHHILNVMAFNVDALRLSAYFYKPRDGKLTFGPIWDFDRALNSTDGRDQNPKVWRSQSSDRGTDFFNYPWWGRLFQDPDFWQRWIDRYQELRRGPMHTNALFGLIDELTGQVRAAQPREAAKWAGFTTPRGSYQNEISLMRTWLTRRLEFMDTNFLAAPTVVLQPGPDGGDARAIVTGPQGATIYLGRDGADPRAAGGGIAAGATTVGAPVRIRGTAPLVLRSYNPGHRNLTGPDNPPISSPWSGPITVWPSLAPGAAPRRLAIAEIHPRPAGPSAAELSAAPARVAADYEFIELVNFGEAPAVLTDLRFDTGVRFSFATGAVSVLQPSARVLLVRNRAAFEQRYGARTNIAGQYEGSLAGEGERLRLVDATSHPVAEATYEPRREATADGLGFSLTWRGAAGYVAIAEADGWGVSSVSGGTPGLPDSAGAAAGKVVIHEVLSHTDPPQLDGIELRNLGPEPVAMGGWYLTDDREVPAKFRIPDGTVIPAGGYVWFDESQFHRDPAAPTSFQLRSTGDTVWLFAADTAGRLTGYSHGLDFGATPNGVSLGREEDCDGREVWRLQSAVTPGAANAGTGVPSVRISEIHYQPADIRVGGDAWNDTAFEFVELANVTDAPVRLFDEIRPDNTWRLTDAVSYQFPASTILAPGGVLLVVNFDPGANPQALGRFRREFAVSANAMIVGPLEGSLPNGGGKVELKRPDVPQQTPSSDAGTVPYYVVDRVSYGETASRSNQAGGTGKSLHRISFGISEEGGRGWVAAVPSPGVVASAVGDTDGDGMPDGWEAAACLMPEDSADGRLDADGDGASNREEYLAATNPRDATDVLRCYGVVTDDSGRVLFSFDAKPGVTYAIEAAGALESGAWRTVRTVPARAREERIDISEVGGGAAQYLRVKVAGAP